MALDLKHPLGREAVARCLRESPALADPASAVWAPVDAAIGDGAKAAFSFLERLVASPSTVGRELPAQQIVAVELASITSGARGLARFMAGFFTAPAVESGIPDRGDRR